MEPLARLDRLVPVTLDPCSARDSRPLADDARGIRLAQMDAMRRVWLAVAVSLVVTTAAVAEERMATPAELAPSQTEVGAYAADFKLDTFRAQAKQKGVSFESFVRGEMTAKFAAKAIPAVVDPNGQIRVLDGHHKLSALRMIEREMGIVVPVKLNIVKDYSGYTFSAYAKHFVGKLGKGYFGANPPKSAVAKMKRLPNSFDKLADNPLRSILGVTFTKSGLEGSWFADYVQFHLGETMLANGLLADMKQAGLLGKDGKIPSMAAADAKVVTFVTNKLFSSTKLSSFLKQRINVASRSEAGAALLSARRAAKHPVRLLTAKRTRAKASPRRTRARARTSQRDRAKSATRARPKR